MQTQLTINSVFGAMKKTRRGLFSRAEPQEDQSASLQAKVESDCVVSIDYTIADDEGHVHDTTEGRAEFNYIHGSDLLLSGIQNALEGKLVGDSISVRLLPKDAFGMHDPERTQAIEPPLFEDIETFEEGMQFEMKTEEGLRLVTVKHVDETEITVDLNHPLAGKILHVNATVKGIRPASEIEKKNNEVF